MTQVRRVGLALLGLGGSLVGASSHAALDITAATTAIGDVNTAVLAIGALVFGLVVAIKTWKWARRAL